MLIYFVIRRSIHIYQIAEAYYQTIAQKDNNQFVIES